VHHLHSAAVDDEGELTLDLGKKKKKKKKDATADAAVSSVQFATKPPPTCATQL
jgi:hypothetical protein